MSESIRRAKRLSSVLVALLVLDLAPLPKPVSAGEVQTARSEAMLSEATSKIEELNQLRSDRRMSLFPKSDSASRDMSERYWSIRRQLALEGVCVSFTNGALFCATRDVLNGFSVEPADLASLAMINFLEQREQDAEKVMSGYKRSGEAQALIGALIRQMLEHGVTVELRGDLCVVQSVKTNSETIADLSPSPSPTNAPTSSSEQ